MCAILGVPAKFAKHNDKHVFENVAPIVTILGQVMQVTAIPTGSRNPPFY